MHSVIVIKLNTNREETWRYEGQVLHEDERSILLEARFNRPDRMFHDILLKQGDPFMELYLTDRWYNIFEIYDRDDRHIKGWYCNVTLPSEFVDNQIFYVDLALDLLVYPNGEQLVLDEDEFAALNLEETLRKGALAALEELRELFRASSGLRVANLVNSGLTG